MRRTLLDKLNTLKMRQALVLITLFLLPSAAWGEPNSVTYTFGSPDLDNNTVVSTTGQATSTSWNIKNLKISNNSYSLNKSESTLGFSVSGSNSAQTATISFDLISDFGITGTVTRIDIEYNTGSKISSGTFSAGKDLENITESLFDNKALETSTSDKTLSFSIPPGNNYHQFFKNDKIHLNFSFSANLSDVSNVYFNIKSITIHTNTISVGGYCPNETGAIIGGNITSYSGKDGDVSSVGYDATNHILTLENAKIQGYLYYSEDADLTIKLIGDNAFFAINNSIGDVLTIIQSTGTQKLTIQKDGQNASLKLFSAFSGSTAPNWDDINLISGFSNTNTELTVLESTNGSNLPGYNQNGKLVAYTTLSLKVAGNSPTTNGTISGSGIEGSVLFDVSSNELTLDNTTISGPIEWNNGNNDLTLYLKGKNSVIINKGESSPVSVFKSESSCSLKVEKVYQAESATLKYASYGTIDGKTSDVASYFDNFILSANTAFNQATSVIDGIRYNYLTTADTYNISVAGIQVHGIEGELGYKNNILNDTGESIVMFDGTNTLTLNNAKISSLSSTHAIETGLSTLNIDLKGNNSITTEGGYALYGATSSGSYRIIFTSSSDPVGNLTLKKSSGYLASYVTIDYDTNTGLVPTIITPTDASDLAAAREAIIAKGTALGITVAGVVVTNSNYTDIKGDGITVEEGGKVMFDTSTNTLTLNGAVLTAPIIIGLSELTIDIQGTNSITTEEKCIQKMENTTPAVTFTSTSDVVGSLTLKGAAGVNNVGEYNEGSFTISDKLALVLKKDGYIYSNTYWFTDGSTKEAILSPSYGVTVGGMQICQDNASDVIGEGIGNGDQGGMVKFTPAVDGTPATLTLNSATISGSIKSSLNDLIIKIAGSSNTLTAILYEGSSTSSTLLIKTPSSSSTVNKLTLENSTGAVISGFSTVTLDGLFFSTPNYPSVTTSTDWNSDTHEAIITNEYGITIGGVDVTTTNKDDVLNNGGKVKFTPADNTASPATPATLTLDGAVITGTISWTKSAPLTIAINGTNSVTTTDAYAIEGNNQDNTTLTIAKVSETGKCKLILSGSTGGSISGFKNSSDTYAGSGLVYYEDQAEHTATILSTLSGSGTSTDPYLIETPEDLKDFSFFVNKQIITNKYIKIANNIDCDGLEGFESIGSSYPFMGTLSGYGNTISNLTINSGLGFFGHISGGIVNDLNFYKLSVKGNSYATGGIASELSAGGQIDNCTLTECTIACLDNQERPEVGGIVARLSGSGSKISNCVVYNSTINASTIRTGVSGPIGYAGGIVASYSSGTITNCHVKDGSKIINVNADDGSTLKTGTIVGNVSSDATTSITSNFYYYDVTVETQLGSSAKETKSGYTPRGTSDNTEDPTGAMLYTKYVIIPISTDAGHVSIGSDYYYQVTSDDTNTTYSVAPDVEVVISVENADVEGSYTLDGAKTIELKPKEGSTGLYTFDMPNADVTFTVQEAAAVSFSEEGQIYVTYYNATKDVAVPMGMTAYIVTGVSEDGTKVIVSPVSYIKKGVAVLVEKDKTTEVSETTDFSGNKLIYADNEVPVTTGSKLYILYQNQFVKVTSGTQIPTGKNYLDLSTFTNAGTRGFYDIGGANDGTSALRGVVAEGTNGKSDAWYTLQGRRLSAKPSAPGLYLRNGVKVVIK